MTSESSHPAPPKVVLPPPPPPEEGTSWTYADVIARYPEYGPHLKDPSAPGLSYLEKIKRRKEFMRVSSDLSRQLAEQARALAIARQARDQKESELHEVEEQTSEMDSQLAQQNEFLRRKKAQFRKRGGDATTGTKKRSKAPQLGTVMNQYLQIRREANDRAALKDALYLYKVQGPMDFSAAADPVFPQCGLSPRVVQNANLDPRQVFFKPDRFPEGAKSCSEWWKRASIERDRNPQLVDLSFTTEETLGEDHDGLSLAYSRLAFMASYPTVVEYRQRHYFSSSVALCVELLKFMGFPNGTVETLYRQIRTIVAQDKTVAQVPQMVTLVADFLRSDASSAIGTKEQREARLMAFFASGYFLQVARELLVAAFQFLQSWKNTRSLLANLVARRKNRGQPFLLTYEPQKGKDTRADETVAFDAWQALMPDSYCHGDWYGLVLGAVANDLYKRFPPPTQPHPRPRTFPARNRGRQGAQTLKRTGPELDVAGPSTTPTTSSSEDPPEPKRLAPRKPSKPAGLGAVLWSQLEDATKQLMFDSGAE